MKRQLPDGTYRWLGVGRARPKGEDIGSTPAPAGWSSTAWPSYNTGRKVSAKGAVS